MRHLINGLQARRGASACLGYRLAGRPRTAAGGPSKARGEGVGRGWRAPPPRGRAPQPPRGGGGGGGPPPPPPRHRGLSRLWMTSGGEAALLERFRSTEIPATVALRL
jgi:hypothetical protein